LISSPYIVRRASLADIDFLAKSIIESEKAGTDTLSYTTIFGLSESDATALIKEMLLEEIDGCELSLSGFLVAEFEGKLAGAMCTWIEGEEGISSSILKGNLLSHYIPKELLIKASEVSKAVSSLAIDYVEGSLCVGIVYVSQEYRGNNLVNILLEKHILDAQGKYPNIDVYIQVFDCNISAVKAYKKVGFEEFVTTEISKEAANNLLPSNKKIMMKKSFKQN
jgi:ribosomal protein S18 acetylase RimI-like enzyme